MVGGGVARTADGMSERHRIVFTPSGRGGLVDSGTTVLDAARSLGVDLDSVCGGRGVCGRCQVMPSIGAFAKWEIEADGSELGGVDAVERSFDERRGLSEGSRLGCRAKVLGDVVVDVPPGSQLHGPVVRKDIDVTGLTLDPVTTLHVVTLPGPALGSEGALAPLLRDRLAAEWGVEVGTIRLAVLSALHDAVRVEEGTITVAVRRESDGPASVVGVWGGISLVPLGVAVDVGSTTIAGHLLDLSSGEVLASAGRMNPQIRLGEDLMSRVSYVMMNPGGERELTELVRDALAELVGELVGSVGASTGDILEVVAVGNPIMHHLLLGIDPTPLGQAPFVLATDEAVELDAVALGLPCPFARVLVGPCIAGHVGADTVAAILAEGPHRSDRVQLLVDVGTNAEIVLGNAAQLYAASSPTGPAFEGAQISCGQRATPGAVERVRIDRATLEPRYKVIGCELWSDEAGFSEAVAGTGVTGVCGSGIIEALGEMYLSGVMSADGVIDGDVAGRCARVEPDERTFSYVLHRSEGGVDLRITQNDVRAVQLAKAALRAGVDLLLEHAGVDEIDEIRLAGAFGAHIDAVYALVLGLIPDCSPDRVRSVGNSAGTGAVRALLSGKERSEMLEVARTVERVETATEPRFQELFVAAMPLPHAHEPSSHLAEVVDLPPTVASPREGGRRRRNRRRS